MGENQTKYCIKVYGIQQRKKIAQIFAKFLKFGWLQIIWQKERTDKFLNIYSYFLFFS